MAKKIKISSEKIQKITNRVDWILSMRVGEVITIGTAIAQAIPHVIEHETKSKKNIKTCLCNALFQVMEV